MTNTEFLNPALAKPGQTATIRLHVGGEVTGTLVQSWWDGLRLDDPVRGLRVMAVPGSSDLAAYIAGIVSLIDPKPDPKPDLPQLPTEAGSVIMDAMVRGERVPLAWHDNSGSQWPWQTSKPVDGELDHGPGHITEFTPATVIPTAELDRLRSEVDRLGGVITPDSEPAAVLDCEGDRWDRLPDGRYCWDDIVRPLAHLAKRWGPLTDAITGEPVTP